MKRRDIRLYAGLALLGFIITALVVPGTFTEDEPHHLALLASLRGGGLEVPGTQGLPACREPWFFWPQRVVARSPVVSVVPPLYGAIATPFSALGIRGLIFINTLSYLATTAIVFRYARRLAHKKRTPWLAAGAFALGGYAIEYALGVWPHMLSVALVAGAALACAVARDGTRSRRAALVGGLLAGMAAGVRYQNVVVVVLLGLGLLLGQGGFKRLRACASYAAGAALPIAVSAAVNQARLGIANPFTKGHAYLNFSVAGGRSREFVDTFQAFYFRVVDFTARPDDYIGPLRPDPDSGAVFAFGEVKKALLQSAPWMVLALVAVILVWRQKDRALRAEVGAISLLLWGVLAAFAWTGFTRTDGIAYNQRYFHELIPVGAVLMAWLAERAKWSPRALGWGVLAGAGIGLAVGFAVSAPLRERLIMKLPLALAACVVVVWWWGRRTDVRAAFGAVLGVALGWGLSIHATDLRASRTQRSNMASMLADARALVPAGSKVAIFAHAELSRALSPLLIEDDVLILDASLGGPRCTRDILSKSFREGRRVFVIANNARPAFLRFVTNGRGVRSARGPRMMVLELECSPTLGECAR